MGEFANTTKSRIKILDPGCGTAVLSCALIEKLVKCNTISHISLTLYETDTDLLTLTRKSVQFLAEWLKERDVNFEWNLITEDFILDNTSLFSTNDIDSGYDFIIGNPPYFKLSKDDSRVITVSRFVNGVSNIYAAFLIIASTLLNTEGSLIFIVPRSFSSGLYFKDFRNFFFRNIRLDHIHLFKSRTEAFARDKVLQETIIIKGVKRLKYDDLGEIVVSSSCGIADLVEKKNVKYREEYLIDFNSKDRMLHLPVDDTGEEVLNLFKSWNGSLEGYNLQISTGPVVAFRLKDEISCSITSSDSVPLLWLHNVMKMKVNWPVFKEGKGQFIKITQTTEKLLIPNKNYILLRRFSAKDDKHRLIAAPHFCSIEDSDKIGVENKLNYIYRPNGHMSRKEIIGLCALLNSSIFDHYFRIFNGNINVSATELRAMPLPPLQTIYAIGEKLILSNDFSVESAEKIVNNEFRMDFDYE